jgi:hypothetical protein
MDLAVAWRALVVVVLGVVLVAGALAALISWVWRALRR